MARLASSPTMDVGIWSFDDLINAYNVPVSDANKPCESQSELIPGNGYNWYGGLRTTKAATDLLSGGWAAGATRLQTLIDEVKPPTAKSRRRVQRWEDQGDDLNVDRAMAGDWDQAWRVSKRQWVAGPQTLTLITAWGGNCGRDAESMFWQGAAAAVICDAMESAGYGVHLIASEALNGHSGNTYTMMATIKESSEPMRLDALAATLCHAGVFRTHAFRFIQYAPTNMGYGLGRPVKGFPDYVIDGCKAAGEWPDGAIVIPYVTDRRECIAVIDAAMKQIAAMQGE